MTLVSSDLPTDESPDAARPLLLEPVRGSWWGRPQNVFLLVALLGGWAMALVTPLMQVPDEPAHLYRIWQLSQGHIIAKNYYTTIPMSFGGLQVRSGAVTANKFPSIPWREMFKGWYGPGVGKPTVSLQIDNTALYSPVPYVPQIFGVLMARKLHWSLVAIVYTGRLATVVGYALVGWWAIRVMPVLKWPAAVTLAAPMAMFMAGSLSADPMTTAFAYLATAFCLRMILAPGPVGRGTVVGLGISLIALTLCKSAYFPIVLLLLAVPRRNWPRERWWIDPVVILVLVLIALFGWSAVSKPLGVHEAGGDPAVQFHYVLYHPGKFLANFHRTLHDDNYPLYISGIGIMGWLDVWMPISFINIFTAAVLWFVLTYDEPLSVPLLARLSAALALYGSTFLVVLANYLVWTKTAARETDGLQGRYLLPLVLLFFVVIQRRGRYRVNPFWVATAMVWCIGLAVWCVFDRYYVT